MFHNVSFVFFPTQMSRPACQFAALALSWDPDISLVCRSGAFGRGKPCRRTWRGIFQCPTYWFIYCHLLAIYWALPASSSNRLWPATHYNRIIGLVHQRLWPQKNWRSCGCSMQSTVAGAAASGSSGMASERMDSMGILIWISISSVIIHGVREWSCWLGEIWWGNSAKFCTFHLRFMIRSLHSSPFLHKHPKKKGFDSRFTARSSHGP